MNQPTDDPLRRHLAGLRDPAPPPALFARITRSQRRRRWRRRLLRGGAFGALLLAALLPLRERLAPAPAPVAVDAGAVLAALQPDPAEAALRRIDRQLQAAYDRGADAETLHALWLARERAALHADSPETADASVISL
jgi:hypothetical protein